jgi:hypothetical protein
MKTKVLVKIEVSNGTVDGAVETEIDLSNFKSDGNFLEIVKNKLAEADRLSLAWLSNADDETDADTACVQVEMIEDRDDRIENTINEFIDTLEL